MNNFFRILFIVSGLILMIGFGLCGAVGLTSGVTEIARTGSGAVFIVLGLIGLGIAFVVGRAVWSSLGKLRRPPSE